MGTADERCVDVDAWEYALVEAYRVEGRFDSRADIVDNHSDA